MSSARLTGFYTKVEPISVTRKLKSSNFGNLQYLRENSMGSQSDKALKCMLILLTSFSVCSWLLISFFSWFSSRLSSSCCAFNCMKTKNFIHSQPLFLKPLLVIHYSISNPPTGHPVIDAFWRPWEYKAHQKKTTYTCDTGKKHWISRKHFFYNLEPDSNLILLNFDVCHHSLTVLILSRQNVEGQNREDLEAFGHQEFSPPDNSCSAKVVKAWKCSGEEYFSLL